MPRGGARIGSGRKPKSAFEREITGNPGHRGKVLEHPGAGQAVVAVPSEPFQAAVDMPSDERSMWDMLAPHAFAAGTLTRQTEASFRLLCRNMVIERAQSLVAAGSANHRGMLQRVDAELLRFCLSPFGKPMVQAQPEAPANPLEKFLNRKRA